MISAVQIQHTDWDMENIFGYCFNVFGSTPSLIPKQREAVLYFLGGVDIFVSLPWKVCMLWECLWKFGTLNNVDMIVISPGYLDIHTD